MKKTKELMITEVRNSYFKGMKIFVPFDKNL